MGAGKDKKPVWVTTEAHARLKGLAETNDISIGEAVDAALTSLTTAVFADRAVSVAKGRADEAVAVEWFLKGENDRLRKQLSQQAETIKALNAEIERAERERDALVGTGGIKPELARLGLKILRGMTTDAGRWGVLVRRPEFAELRRLFETVAAEEKAA